MAPKAWFGLVLLALVLVGGDAFAAITTICLRTKVTIDDETGAGTEVGTSGNWPLRGVAIYDISPASAVSGSIPTYTGAGGCFDVNLVSTGNLTVSVRSKGYLDWEAHNSIYVYGASGSTQVYSVTKNVTSLGGTVNMVFDPERSHLTLYAIAARSLAGFHGHFDYERVDVHSVAPGDVCAGCNSGDAISCGTSDGIWHICIPESQSFTKFIIAHELGHVVLAGAVNTDGMVGENCSYGTSGHGMRGLEYSSCAALEGWAHFYAADVWNNENPYGRFNWWGGGAGGDSIDVEYGQGGCATVSGDTAANYRVAYADHCFSDAATPFDTDAKCAGGNCIGVSTELDWMRTWFDYHHNGGTGVAPNHAQLQAEIGAGQPYGAQTFYEELFDAIDATSGATQASRLEIMAEANGTTE
jgi:hypothetical protein